MNPFWGKVLLFTLLTGAAIKYAPEPSEDVYLTQWIAMYTAPRDLWLNLNAKHTAQEVQVSQNNLLIADAQPPAVHRFRYPQSVSNLHIKFASHFIRRSLNQGSPFLNRIGEAVDMRNVVPKTDKL
jgi:hypothetical protein